MTMHDPSGMPDQPSPFGRTPDHRPGDTIEKVRLRHPRDLLAVIPYLLGFHPADSVVVVALDRGEVAITLRVDDDALHDVLALWQRLSRPLTEAGTDALAVVAYTGPDREPGVLAFAGASPWPVLDVLRAHDRRWWSLTCPNGPGCCPPGEPYEPDPAVTAPVAFRGVSPAASRDDLAACLRPGPDLLLDAVAALLPLDPAPPAPVLIHALDTAHAERETGPVPLAPGQAALLLHAVGVIEVRDTCCAWHDDAALWLWTDLVHAAPPGWVTPAATLLAVTALQRGDSTLAQLATEHALAADPGYRLAQLVAGLIEAAIHPRRIRDAMAYAVAEAGAARREADHDHPAAQDTRTATPTNEIVTTKETPMGTNARIEPGGYVTVDVNAWLEQRTGGPIDELTADLHRWADTHPDPDAGDGPVPPARDWTATARTWCQDRASSRPPLNRQRPT